MAYKRKSVQIKGMYGTCCEHRIEHGLQSIPGIHSISVRYPIQAAFIHYDPELLNWSRVDRHLMRLGYQRVETIKTVTLSSSEYGNHLMPEKLRSLVSATPWIQDVQFAPNNSSVSISYDSRAWTERDIMEILSVNYC